MRTRDLVGGIKMNDGVVAHVIVHTNLCLNSACKVIVEMPS